MRLSKNWSVESEKHQWTLEFTERRQREKLDQKRNKTGEVEDYDYSDQWYFPTLKQALKKYVDEALKPLPTIGAVILKLDELEEQISKLKVK